MILASTLALTQGAVHVVDLANGPGTEFTDLSDAVAAAESGDLLLVRSGVYPDAIVLDGKALVVVAETGASVEAQRIETEDLAAGTWVAVRGLSFQSTTDFDALIARDAGPVWLESVLLASQPIGPGQGSASGGLFADASSAVVLSRCSLDPLVVATPLGTLEVRNGSRAHVFGSTVAGPSFRLGAGAIEVRSSFLELFGSTATGATGVTSPFCVGQDGGPALVLSGASSEVRILDSLLVGGAPAPPAPGCPPSQPGAPLVVQAGTATSLAGTAHAYEVGSPVREGEPVGATVGGNPGDLVWILFSDRPGLGVRSRFFDGEILVESPQVLFVGAIPASGVLAFGGTAPALPAGSESSVLFTQAIVRDAATGRFAVGYPSMLAILDAVL